MILCRAADDRKLRGALRENGPQRILCGLCQHFPDNFIGLYFILGIRYDEMSICYWSQKGVLFRAEEALSAVSVLLAPLGDF